MKKFVRGTLQLAEYVEDTEDRQASIARDYSPN